MTVVWTVVIGMVSGLLLSWLVHALYERRRDWQRPERNGKYAIVSDPAAPEPVKAVSCPKCRTIGAIRIAEILHPFSVGGVVRSDVIGARYACQRCPCIFNATGNGETWDVCAESYPYTPERTKPKPQEEAPPSPPRAQPPAPIQRPRI